MLASITLNPRSDAHSMYGFTLSVFKQSVRLPHSRRSKHTYKPRIVCFELLCDGIGTPREFRRIVKDEKQWSGLVGIWTGKMSAAFSQHEHLSDCLPGQDFVLERL